MLKNVEFSKLSIDEPYVVGALVRIMYIRVYLRIIVRRARERPSRKLHGTRRLIHTGNVLMDNSLKFGRNFDVCTAAAAASSS